jgi:peptidoglycan/LPS O-acetylase OafA/YrhL
LDHAAIPGFNGGFIGVDVFFVISGFLITGLLIGDVAKYSKVRFLNFYARRAARILPAASVVLVGTALASVAILGILQARSELADSVWAVFFAANIHFAAIGTNYFAANTGISPIQHYWSLAVEEQFYLVWPAVIGIVAFAFRGRGDKHVKGRVPRIPLAVLLSVVGGASLYLSITQTSANPAGAYFSTLDRVWELALGALLAVAIPALSKIPGAVKSVLSWAGIAGILAATFLFSASTAIPGWKALLPVLASGAVLVGGIGAPKGGAHRLLSLRPFRFIGDISYSLYLWHFPILILGAAYLGKSDTLGVRFALIGGATGVATLSYYGLENPLRHARILLKRAWHGLVLWPVAVGAVLTVAVLAAPTVPFVAASAAATTAAAQVPVATAIADAVAAGQANAAIPSATTPSLLSAATDSENIGACSAYNKLTSKICEYGDPTGTKTVVVIGASHSTMWVPAIAAAAKADHWKFFPVVKEACGYEDYTDTAPGGNPNNTCAEWYKWAKVQIAKLHPNVIIIGSYTDTKYWARGEATIIAQLKPLTKRVILLSDTPWIPEPAGCLLKPNVNQGSCLWQERSSRVQAAAQTKAIAGAAHVNYIDVTPWFCDAGLCPSIINDIIPYKDGAHVTPQYATYLGTAMTVALNLNGASTIQPTSVAIPTTSTTTTSVPTGS